MFNVFNRRNKKHEHSSITGRLLYCLEKVSCSNEDNLSRILTKSSVVQHTLSSKWQVARDKNNIMKPKNHLNYCQQMKEIASQSCYKRIDRNQYYRKIKEVAEKWTQAEHRRQTVSLSTDSTFKRFTEWPTLFPHPMLFDNLWWWSQADASVFFCIFLFFPFFLVFFLLFNRCHRHSSVEFFLPVLIWNKLHLFRRNVCNIIYIFDKQNWQQKAP